MRHLDLFSGIGGFALATEMVWPEVEHIFCDNEPFSQAILKKHWPTAKIYGDIRTLTYAESKQADTAEQGRLHTKSGIRDTRPFILTGGFPCQPFSQAGRRKGTGDDRFLWPEMLRVIREFRPRWVVGENVAGLLSIQQGVVFEQVCADLEGEGYEVQPFVIPAVAVNAPHRRDRVWIVGYNDRDRRAGGSKKVNPAKARQSPLDNLTRRLEDGADAPDTKSKRSKRSRATRNRRTGLTNETWRENWLEVATRLCTLDDGLRYDVVRPDGGRDAEVRPRPKGWRNAALKGAGNAIVPAVAAEIMRAIRLVDESNA